MFRKWILLALAAVVVAVAGSSAPAGAKSKVLHQWRQRQLREQKRRGT